MTTPNLSLPELAANQTQPHVPVNAALRRLDALVQLTVLSISNTPPGSPADGDRYIVGDSPTGAWVGHEHDVVAFIGTGWIYWVPAIGWQAFVQALGLSYVYGAGSPIGWEPLVVEGGGGAATVVTDSTTARDALPAHAGNYTRFTNASAKTYTFDDIDGFSAGEEYHARNVGAGNLTLVEAGGMTLNAPADGTLVVPQGGTVTVKMVASDEADVIGVTVLA